MDLHEAMAIIQSPILLAGDSNEAAAGIAGAGLSRSTALPLPELDGGVQTRPIHLLHRLSLATWFVHQHPTVFDAFRQWAVLRYIGAFDVPSDGSARLPTLKLSEAARRVTRNQRRVLSEDLGIATAVSLGRRWFASAHPGMVPNIVDIDVAMDLGLVHSTGARRSDYLLTAVDPRSGHLLAYGQIEAKGSSNGPYSRSQLRGGAQQIESTALGKAVLPGLVSALLAGSDLRYAAVEVLPLAGGGPVDLGPARGIPRAAMYPSEARDAADEILRSDWTRLAEIANDDGLMTRVTTRRLWQTRAQGESARRGRTEERSVRDANYVGTAALIPLPGGTLRAFLGVDVEILSALDEGDPLQVTQAQARSRRRDSLVAEPLSQERAVSIQSGTALVLEPAG